MTDSLKEPKARSTVRSSLFVKILAVIAMSSATLALATAYIGTSASKSIALSALTREAKTTTESIAANSGGALRFGKPEQITTQYQTLSETTKGAFSEGHIFNVEGEPLGQSQDTATDLETHRNLALLAIETGEFQGSENGLTVAAPVRMGDGKPVVGAITTTWSPHLINGQIWSSWSTRVPLIIGLFLFTLAVSSALLKRQVTRPMEAVRDTILKIRDGALDAAVPYKERTDEVGQIAASVDMFRISLQEASAADAKLQKVQENQRIVVDHISVGLNALSQGDLTYRLSNGFPAEHDSLREDFNRTVQKLSDTMASLTESSNLVLSSSNALNSSAGDLSQRSNMQAATLEETAATVSELTDSVKTAAASANDVKEIVTKTESETNSGVGVVKDAMSAMKQIENSSSQIGQIISLIQDIAFQTNLLALNAGVEAARAGETGRGFAVVASEVRALAQRSSVAAEEISELIAQSVKHVERGSGLVNQTGAALDEIANQVSNVSGLIGTIASNVTQQSSSLTEINDGMQQLDRVTQQNAAMVDDTTQLSRGLREESTKLSKIVGSFDFDTAIDTSMAA